MSLTLTRSVASEEKISNQHVWPLRVSAASSTAGLDPEIFVYHAEVSGNLLAGDLFECVASVSQMSDLGLTADFVSDPAVPYYRSDSLEFFCRSESELESLWKKIQQDAKELLDNFNSFNNISAEETVEIT